MSTGYFNLAKNSGATAFTVTSATTQTGDVITDLDGMKAVSIEAKFTYGSGGTNVKVYVQTSLDQGTTWIDIACIVFATTNETQVANLSGLTAVTTLYTPTDAALTDDTCKDGVLGDRLRAKIVSTGTYATSTQVAVHANVR